MKTKTLQQRQEEGRKIIKAYDTINDKLQSHADFKLTRFERKVVINHILDTYYIEQELEGVKDIDLSNDEEELKLKDDCLLIMEAIEKGGWNLR